jgi:predicted small lipoprotein YifL
MRMAAIARAETLATLTALATLATLATLTGCGKPAPPPSVVAMPTRKAGLWEQSLTRDGKPGRLGGLTICLDAAADAKLGIFGRHFAKGDCQRSITRDETGAYHFSSTCAVPGGATVITRGVAAGDFKTGYDLHSDIEVRNAPFEPMNGMHVISISGRYRGPCPAGMHPGDLSLGSGLKINIDQLPQVAAAMGAGGGL